MKKRAFLSHSWAQKNLVIEVAKELGDKAIVDHVDFIGGARLEQQMQKAVDDADLFVLFLSENAIKSASVVKEIDQAKLKFFGKPDQFIPILVEDNYRALSKKYKEILPDNYLLRYSRSPKIIARNIEDILNRLMPFGHYTSDIQLVGRQADLAKLENYYYSKDTNSAIIVSGQEGVGRTAFARKICVDYFKDSINSTINRPLEIELGEYQTTQDFAVSLNDIFRLYEHQELIKNENINYFEEKSIALIDEAILNKEPILIIDNGACVLNNGQYSTWFLSIIEKIEERKFLTLVVVSKYRPQVNHGSISSIHIHELDKNGKKNLFIKLLKNYDISIDASEFDFFLEKMPGMPRIIIYTIEAIRKFGSGLAKEKIKMLIAENDYNLISLYNELCPDTLSKNIIIYLSMQRLASYKEIETIFIDTAKINETLERGLVLGVIDVLSDCYKLSESISDYIARNKQKLDKKFQITIKDTVEKSLSNFQETDEILFASDFLRTIKEAYSSGITVDPTYLVSSIILRDISERYHRNKEYNRVIDLCKVHIESSDRFYPEIKRDLVFFMCLSLAKTSNNDFFQYINKFEFSLSDEKFLFGFYYRNKREFSRAENYYKDALKDTKSDKMNISKTKRELVIVYIEQRKYQEALDLSRENYNNFPYNSYHIEAYFQCLIRDKNPKSKALELKQLIISMEQFSKGNSFRRISHILDVMKNEYLFFVDGKIIDSLKKARELEKEYPTESYPSRSSFDLHSRQGISY